MMKNKNKILFILFVVLGSFMFCDAVFMLFDGENTVALKDILFGVGFGSIGFVYLLSSKEQNSERHNENNE